MLRQMRVTIFLLLAPSDQSAARVRRVQSYIPSLKGLPLHVDMGIVILLLFTFLLYRSWRSSTSARLPPGPARLPIIGSLHRVPFGYQQHAFFAWKKTYGASFLSHSCRVLTPREHR